MRFTAVFILYLMAACSSSLTGKRNGSASADFDCSGECLHQNLSVDEISFILRNTIGAATQLEVNATIAILDRVGNVLALYQMSGADATVEVNGQISATGGLEGRNLPASLVAISKAGTAAFLSSQGQAFSTRTASQIIQEHFNPGELFTPGGPLFGVQFSQLPCSDINVRQATFADGRTSGTKASAGGLVGPRFLPLGLSADSGGIPLYERGDLVGGLGVEVDGIYRIDRNIFDVDNDIEERIAMMGSLDFEAPSKRVASNINVGKTLRYTDLSYDSLDDLTAATSIDPANYLSLSEFTDGSLRAGSTFGSTESGVALTTRASGASGILVDGSGVNRFPSTAGTAITGGGELTIAEVDALLDSAITTARRTRAAIRRPLGSFAQVNIWVVDHLGTALGFTRTPDAPIFGIDVALQKARTAALFSSTDAGTVLSTAGLSDAVARIRTLLGNSALTGLSALSSRTLANLSRPYFPDGIAGSKFGPASLPFPGQGSLSQSWSPFNTGIQSDLILTKVLEALGVISSANFPENCGSSRYGNGIQIFAGGVPLYRGTTLIGGIGVSGDGIDQDDLVAFYGASRQGLNTAGHLSVGDSTHGFLAPVSIRADQTKIPQSTLRLRFVNCPESPFIGSESQDVCSGL